MDAPWMKCLAPLLLLSLIACESDKAVTTFNADPTATITSHAHGSEILEGYTVEFTG